MSTKTTFKRIALVAVAALGLGVLSVAPSSAAVLNLTAVTTAGTATTTTSDSTTGAALAVRYTSNAAGDSVTITSFVSAAPTASALAAAPRISVLLLDTATSSGVPTVGTLGTGAGTLGISGTTGVTGDSVTAIIADTTKTAANAANFDLFFSTATGLVAGTYTITAVITALNAGAAPSAAITRDVNIVVSRATTQSTVSSIATSTLGAISTSTALATVSSSNTARATLVATLLNASSNAASESLTATITGPGTIGSGSVVGKSVVLAYTGATTLNVYSDGTAGVSTITVSTPSITFPSQTITFYAKSPKTITAAVYNPVLNVGANATAVAATAVDANGNNWAGALSIKAVAAADALIGGSATAPVACEYNSTVKTHFCPITTTGAGTAKYVVVDQSAALGTETAYGAAMSAATSNEVTVTVSAGAPTTVKIAFDKATYQPFEKALITVTPLDAAGKTLGTKTINSIFAAGGISSNIAFGSQSDTLTSVNVITAAANDTDVTAGSKTYTVYMPAQGDVTISATGGTGLAAVGQVKVTASATVVNSSVDAATDAANEATDAANAATDAALAAADAADAATAAAQDASDAVAALSASVSKLISSLRAQITSLTNLVIKIQKKVRA
jgi:trimeric autotransporter adhesin